MPIPDSVIQQIQERADIVEVISGYVPLKKAGRNFKALCPFHHEKTSSFMVSPEKQIFHCFGCGEGGNIFGFLMKIERLNFPEAVELMAERLGIAIPKSFGRDSPQTDLYQGNALACRYYHELLVNSPAAQAARSYLAKRGIQNPTIEKFQLGFAPDQWEGLIQFTRARGMSSETLARAGLALSREGGGYYDRFRNRLIFPIFDLRSRPIAFGGRVMDEEGSPKYLNSPETEIYQKGRQLYGLSMAKESIRAKDAVLIVEGYFDLIQLVQAGFEFVVATLGTALTTDQIRLLKRFTHRVIVVYDGDCAGELAALRGLDLLLEEGCEVRLIGLPKGKDPDDFIRIEGAHAFREKLQAAKDLLDYKLGLLLNQFDIQHPHEKAQVAQEMISTINRIASPVLKGLYLKRLAERLQVREQDLYEELTRLRKPDSFARVATNQRPEVPLAEKLIVRLIFEYPTAIERVRNEVTEEDFQTPEMRDLMKELLHSSFQKKDVKTWVNQIQDSNQVRMLSGLLAWDEEILDPEKNLQDCIRWLKQQRLRKELQTLQQKIVSAQEKQGSDLKDLLVEYQEVLKVRQQLR